MVGPQAEVCVILINFRTCTHSEWNGIGGRGYEIGKSTGGGSYGGSGGG